LDADPRLGSANGLLWRVDSLGSAVQGVDSAGVWMTRTRQQKLRHQGSDFPPRSAQRIFGPDGSAAFYRREMLADVAYKPEGEGGASPQIFDADFFMHKEDI